MQECMNKIYTANAEEIETILHAVLNRYGILFPDWQISTLSIHKSSDRIAQIDQTIALLEKMKQ